MPRHACFLVPILGLVTAAPAFAQVAVGGVGVGVGVGPRAGLVSPPGWYGPGPARGAWRNDLGPGNDWSYYNLRGGPFVGGGYGYGYPWGFGWAPPGAFGSFWTNGLSLYGPPVPVYGPTPGVFGGGDEHKTFFNKPPPTAGVFFGLGWAGSRSPSPRPYPNVSVYPGGTGGIGGVPVGPEIGTPPASADCFRLTVRLPDPAAELWVEKAETKSRGAERVFDSPPLKAGESYRYELIARWVENGQPRAESRTVSAKPGESFVVDFTKPGDGGFAGAVPAPTPGTPLPAPRPLP